MRNPRLLRMCWLVGQDIFMSQRGVECRNTDIAASCGPWSFGLTWDLVRQSISLPLLLSYTLLEGILVNETLRFNCPWTTFWWHVRFRSAYILTLRHCTMYLILSLWCCMSLNVGQRSLGLFAHLLNCIYSFSYRTDLIKTNSLIILVISKRLEIENSGFHRLVKNFI